MRNATLIGIDVGTTATKAVLLDLEGNRLADFAESYPMARPAPGAAEQDPRHWMAAVLGALAYFEQNHDLAGLQGVGFASQVNTHVFVDAAGEALRPALVWQDSRPAEVARQIDATITEADKIRWFGAPIPVDASHALARIAYIARHEPQVFAATRHVLLPKDYCILALTGVAASDPVAAVGLVDAEGYVAELLARVPGAERLLPPLFDFQHVAGRIRPGLPCAGAPVVVGAMDAWAGMFGVGVVDDGDAMLQSGTSEIAGIVSSSINPTPGVILFPPYHGITMHAAPTQSGGASLMWFARLLDKTPGDVVALAGQSSPGSAIPLFLPHLQGERAPLWDAHSRGVFARMDTRAGAAEMARAVLEGVAFSVGLAFDALSASAGGRPALAHTGGGGARSALWNQIKTDVLGFPLKRTSVPDAAAVGAAILAGLGSGAFPSLRAAVHHLVRYDTEYRPAPGLETYYAEKAAEYRHLYDALKSFNVNYREG
jgi:xylulokinase